MAGIQDWMGDYTNLHATGRNGLERLADRGLEEIQRVLESDRYFRSAQDALVSLTNPLVYRSVSVIRHIFPSLGDAVAGGQ